MSFNKFVEWAFYAIITGTAVTSVSILSNLSDSVNKLNIQVATMIETSNWTQKTLEDYGERLKALERERK